MTADEIDQIIRQRDELQTEVERLRLCEDELKRMKGILDELARILTEP
jgi:hypothetical protein